MSSPDRMTTKTCAVSRRAGRRRFLLAFVCLLALPGCSSEQLQSFSEVMRAMNDDIRSTHSAYPATPQPVLQPDPSQWCIRITGIPPVGTAYAAQLQNTCNETVHVMYGYRATPHGVPHRFPWCAPGHAGLMTGTASACSLATCVRRAFGERAARPGILVRLQRCARPGGNRRTGGRGDSQLPVSMRSPLAVRKSRACGGSLRRASAHL